MDHDDNNNLKKPVYSLHKLLLAVQPLFPVLLLRAHCFLPEKLEACKILSSPFARDVSNMVCIGNFVDFLPSL